LATPAKKAEEGIALEKRMQLAARFKNDFEFYSAQALKIRPKEGSLVPFVLNKAQKYLHLVAEKQILEKGRVRILVLKGRQQGISTYIEGRLYWKVTHRKGVYAFILTHEDKATANLFKMAKRYNDNCLPMLKPVTGSQAAKELSFPKLDSGYGVGTAGTQAVGRSSTPQYFHGSEVAFWPHADTHSTGVMQGVPLVNDTEIFLESTANGMGNYFHSQWQLAERGENDYIAVFLPWYWQDEYKLPCPEDFELTHEEFDLLNQFKNDGLTAEHLNWRRLKIREFTAVGDDGEWKFKQEYPFTAAEAFQTSGEESLIDPQVVMKARKQEKQMSGAHIVGVDPARFGKDRTAIIHRNGRKMYGHKFYRKKSTMEIAGICNRILQDPATGKQSDVDMMFIDTIGIGAGVYDRLAELGFEDQGRIMSIESSRRALDDNRFVNKRAEMGVALRDWFEQPGGVDIEDEDVLQADLCCVQYSYDSSGRYVLEKKEHIMARGLESPDFFDAPALTFAEPVAPPNLKKRKQQGRIQTINYDV
jgi:hypothetical protein